MLKTHHSTVIPAPHAPAATNHRRQMSAPNSLAFTHNSPPASGFETASQPSPLQAAALSIERSPTPLLLGGGLMRATATSFTSRVASKASKATKASSTTTVSGSSSGSNWAKISAKARALNPDETTDPTDPDSASTDPDAPTPIRREKWKGKSFASLALEALRSATAQNHMLTINQITAHVEEYRLTTDMELPALPQTIRAAVMRNCRRPKKPDGLWVHVPDEGKRTGRYRLLPEGFAEDAVVVD